MSSKVKGLVVLCVLVVAGAVLYFGFFRSQAAPSNTNATPTSKFPAKEHILGLDSAPADLKTFMSSEFDRQNQTCKQTNASAELAMGVYKVVRDTFAVASLGCGEGGTNGYYAKVEGAWQKVFEAEELPECKDVNASKFTKEIIPDCVTDGQIAQNQNP